MRQRFTYDCVLIKEDDGYCASFPQIPGAFADGDTREEAIAHATEALMAFLADDLNNGLTPRITALVKAGKLDVELVDGRRMITIDSIERYAAQERHAGRPKKFVAVQ